MDIAQQICYKVTRDLQFGIGNPEAVSGPAVGYFSDTTVANEALAMVRNLYPQFGMGGGFSTYPEVMKMGKIAQAGRIGNCDENAYLAFMYLFTDVPNIKTIKLMAHPGCHSFVAFTLDGNPEEFVIDPWAYIVHRDAAQDARHEVGWHLLKDHDNLPIWQGKPMTVQVEYFDLGHATPHERQWYVENMLVTTEIEQEALIKLGNDVDKLIADSLNAGRISRVISMRSSACLTQASAISGGSAPANLAQLQTELSAALPRSLTYPPSG